jgi:hypothetical protein
MNLKTGKYFVAVVWDEYNKHVLLSLHKKWRLKVVHLKYKCGYTRIYIGPLEIEINKGNQ